MPWDLTLPPRHPAAFDQPIDITAEAVAKASGAHVAATNSPIRAMKPAEREAAAWEAGYGVGALTERRKLATAGSLKGQPGPDAIVWDDIVAETNAQAGVLTPGQEA